MEWKCCGFNQLTPHELYAILRMRSAVFVVEYAHIHLDLDNQDEEALHVFAFRADASGVHIVTYARLLPGDDQDPEVTIDRILTHADRREDDTHDLLMAHVLAAAQAMSGGHPIHVQAPAGLEACYERFGFRKIAGPFLDYGMPCITMARRPSAIRQVAPAAATAVQWVSPPAAAVSMHGR